MAATFQRVLPLEGGCNFRDLGDYQTNDGRRIRPATIFRSGVMSYLTPNDHPHLTGLELRTICDLRRADEREQEPTRWPNEIKMIAWDLDQGKISPTHGASYEKKTIGADYFRDAMIGFYRAMPRVLHPQLKGILEHLVRGEVPLLFNCTAGKDRTGFSAAILLHILGVPRETIFEDYELTNQAVDLQAFMLKNKHTGLGLASPTHTLQEMGPEVWSALLVADRAYLTASFEQIEEDHDSVDNYVRDVLCVDAEVIEQLRDALLVD